MERESFSYQGLELPLYRCHTLIIGSGAAALNCAYHLKKFGVSNLLIVTEFLGGGTSNNSGSDKQTYYKLSLFGEQPDSVYEMARNLYSGGAMHGDLALIEAALSAQEFYHLVESGVPFPHNVYGGYVGYKTDHDPKQRAVSAGPWTSNQMFQKLLAEVKQQNTPILDQHEVIFLLTADLRNGESKVIGAVAVNKNASGLASLALFQAENIIMATGGPGGLYQTSVYPEGQLGSTGIALEAGAKAVNLTEWQYGLASIKFRWNVSGTYQQVIPRYFSTAADDSGEDDFLNPFFPTMAKLATAIFLKGYQWPFDPGKIADYGSSLIDLLVYRESVLKGRRVFMDFRQNLKPGAGLDEFRFKDLTSESYQYLANSNAFLATPYQRLQRMNPMAISLYQQHGIDLAREPLEVAVCAQHNNGGLEGNIWWESNLRHLFPIGEVSGTHGVYRPGGSALNSGQVGGFRAAEYIAAKYNSINWECETFRSEALKKLDYIQKVLQSSGGMGQRMSVARKEIQSRMTKAAAHIRKPAVVRQALKEAEEQYHSLNTFPVNLKNQSELLEYFRNRQLCLTQLAVLTSVHIYLEALGGSRGSYLVLDEGGTMLNERLEPEWRCRLEQIELRKCILEYQYLRDRSRTTWIPVRELPPDDFWFENVWSDYVSKKIYDCQQEEK